MVGFNPGREGCRLQPGRVADQQGDQGVPRANGLLCVKPNLLRELIKAAASEDRPFWLRAPGVGAPVV
eukprot:3084095-Alexandrium_andersonii.AAC.1